MHREEGDFADRGDRDDRPDGPEPSSPGGVLTPGRVVIGLVVLLLLIFAIANFNRVEVNFLLFTTRARVVTVIVVSAVLGFVAGYFVGRPSREERKRLRA